MFTGLVTAIGTVEEATDSPEGRRLVISAPWADLALGESVAVNGACLTVDAHEAGRFGVRVVATTLARTALGHLAPGGRVNLERALALGDRLGGHWVQGHVDGVGEVSGIEDRGGEWRVRIACGREFADQCIPKGSVCLDGISLTIAELHEDSFVVAIIPHTRQVTSIRAWGKGTRVNLEADMIGKYVRRQLQQQTRSSVDDDLLRRAGFIS